MKGFILFTLLAILATRGVYAQNRSISFEQTKVWHDIVKKARQEKRLIFIDCHTWWCGACKIMAAQTFTQDSVADYFNENFVNVMYDMEKDTDGVILRKKLGINIFPTLLFIDPTTQEVVHYVIGARKAETLIADGQQALDPKNNLVGLKKRYAAGERDLEFTVKYLAALSSIYQKDEVSRIVPEYLKTLTPEQLATKAGWEFINEYMDDPLSSPLQLVMSERKKFYTLVGKEAVDAKLNESIRAAVQQLTSWTPEKDSLFNEKRNRELIEYLLKIDSEVAPEGLAKLYLAAYARKGDFRGLLDKMKEVESYNLLRGRTAKYHFRQNISKLTQCKNNALVEEGIKRIDTECAVTNDYLYKAELMNCKANLQTHIGDTAGAAKSKTEEEKYLVEGRKRKVPIHLSPKY
ncbi:thioredoxin fold domain-containing protein [uncultured Butyricimonas sp.]|uniref:thioredoxin family protein n=1 Tax=uncultured Butyricimonas sp. TaxID=1268785 RepID=UPI0026DBF0B8|nr:thioredoxin fold domain-containing protein [uncultured Butyricimonas sp.]